MRVFCYFNLHRKCFSLRAMDGPNKGRVVAHADAVHLTDVAFKVSEAGRERVLREKRKNVHAGATGTLNGFVLQGTTASATWRSRKRRFAKAGTPVSYSPYRAASFFEVATGAPVASAAQCLLHGTRAIDLN